MSDEKRKRGPRGAGYIYQDGLTWWIQYYANGRRHRENAHTTKERAAGKLLRKRIAAAEAGQHVEPEARRVTFDDLKAGLVNRYKLDGRRSLDRAERALKVLGETFGGVPALNISGASVSAYATARKEAKAAPASIHYEISILKRAFNLAVRGGLLPAKVEVDNVKVSNARQGFFERADFEAFRAALPAEIRPVVTFAYLTGWRIRSEILPLTWDRVDFKAGIVRLEPGTTKNDEGRQFPITALPELEAALRAQLEATRAAEKRTGHIIPLVFHREGEPIRSFRWAWAAAIDRAAHAGEGTVRKVVRPQLLGRIPHDFRRTAVRNLERAGVPRSVAMKLVGHKTESIYLRYAIVAEQDLRDGVAKLAALDGAGAPVGQGIAPAPARRGRRARAG